MTTNKQIQMVIRDMLFITWAVEPEVLRGMVHPRLELDTCADSSGEPVAFVSAVCFRVEELRSSVLPLPRVSFEQVNYRAYVTESGSPAVCFLDMRLNSRMVTALTGFLRVPVSYEDIDITATTNDAKALHYGFTSAGLRAEAVVGDQDVAFAAEPRIKPEFITERLVGYVGAGNSIFKLEVEHSVLDTSAARITRVEAPRLKELGVLSGERSVHPHSALYVRETVFGTNPPARVW